jgi:hypothetical protein
MVKDKNTGDNLYTRAMNKKGQLYLQGQGEIGHLERGVLKVAPSLSI